MVEQVLKQINRDNAHRVNAAKAVVRAGNLEHQISKFGRASHKLELARKKVAYELDNADDGFKDDNSDWLILSLHRAENALKDVTAASKAIKALVEEGHVL
jgi:UDP-N-acetylglucosamine 2-epimerase